MSKFSRRQFIFTAGISASAVLLKGCLGNPPEPADKGRFFTNDARNHES